MDDSTRRDPPERERTEDGPRPGLGGILRPAVRYFRPYAWPSALILLTLLLQTAFRSLVPIGYQQIFDRAILERNLTLLATILGLLGGGWVVQAAASLVQDHASARAGYRAANDVRLEMFDHLLRLPVGYYQRVHSGDLMSRFSNDLAVIENAFVRALHTFLFSALILGVSVVLLFVVEWRLALVTFAALPVALFGPKVLGSRAQWHS